MILKLIKIMLEESNINQSMGSYWLLYFVSVAVKFVYSLLPRERVTIGINKLRNGVSPHS